MRAAKTGQRLSEETKAKIAAAKRGQEVSAETRRRLSVAGLGKRRSAETRRRISEAQKTRPTLPWEEKCYKGKHQWVAKNFPDPGGCEFCGVRWMRLEWANLSGEYRQDPEDWKRLCVRCHRRYDAIKRKASA
jgi:NUMOD3 motif-containing protein